MPIPITHGVGQRPGQYYAMPYDREEVTQAERLDYDRFDYN